MNKMGTGSVRVRDRLRPLKTALRSCCWRVRRIVNPPRLPANGDGRVLLHLGCGPVDAPGYTNVDIQPFPHVHYVHPVHPLEMFPSGSADLIYASHILEHYPFAEARAALKEWYRVLRPGGILRLGVPDFKTLLRIYEDSGDLREIAGPLMGGQGDPHNFHQSAFDERFLREMLLEAGFGEVRPWDPAAVANHNFQDTTTNIWRVGDKEYAISLNLEAVK